MIFIAAALWIYSFWQRCPYLVALHGEPGGAEKRHTVKRGYIWVQHLSSLTAEGKGKICFSICLCFFFFAYRFVQMVLWTLFTLGCYPRCFENWWVNTVCMLRFKKYDSFKNKIQFILGSIFPSGLCIYIYLFIYSYIVYIVYFPQQFCFHINKWKNTKATLI